MYERAADDHKTTAGTIAKGANAGILIFTPPAPPIVIVPFVAAVVVLVISPAYCHIELMYANNNGRVTVDVMDALQKFTSNAIEVVGATTLVHVIPWLTFE